MHGAMFRLSRILAVLSSLAACAAGVRAQVQPGQVAPPLEVAWTGTPVAIGTAGPVVVVAFHRSLAAAACDGDVLRDLDRRGGEHGVLMIVVLAERLPANQAPAQQLPVALAVDTDGRARARWLGEQADGYVVLAEHDRIAWTGQPGQGLRAAVALAAAGEYDFAASAERLRQRQQLEDLFTDVGSAAARELAQRVVTAWPTDGPSWAIRWLGDELRRDDAAAAATAAAALAALADDPRALAAFADLALRAATQPRVLAGSLLAPLAVAAANCPDDLCIQLARLRALVHSGNGREVGRTAQQLARKVEGVGAAAVEFVEILTHDAEPEVHKDLGARALRVPRPGDVDARTLAAVRYAQALRCERNAIAAREVACDYLDRLPGRAVVNNEAWELMTALPSCGRFDAFALALAERMLEQRAALEPFELDTAALAMFRNGRGDEAIELQAAAVERSGGDATYKDRLEHYRAALAGKPAPR